MRDLVLTLFLYGSVPAALRWPIYGALLYTWVSVMNPHRLTWGFAYNQPFAQLIAIATLAGILFARSPKRLPLTPSVVVLLMLIAWMSISTVFALDPISSPVQWNKMIKIQLMIFVTMYLLHTRQHIHALVCVLVLSVGFYGVKGGIFTLTGGGGERVYGPEGSYIAENNALAVAVLMVIPLMRYIQLQVTKRWLSWGLLFCMAMCFFSALGSQSRGALLAIAATFSFLWIKSRKKFLMGMVIVLMIPVGVAVMSEKWEKRMQTIETYQEDSSAMGRINAWWMAYNMAKDRPLVGGGFESYGPSQYARYAPNPTDVHAWHSIYFTMLGEHGFVGLALFLLMWYLVWRDCNWIKRRTEQREGWKWAADLATMTQVSLVAYASGGAFLSLAYYDVPYYTLAVIALLRVLVEKELKGSEAGWFVPGRRPANAAGAATAAASPATSRGPGGGAPAPGMRAISPAPARGSTPGASKLPV